MMALRMMVTCCTEHGEGLVLGIWWRILMHSVLYTVWLFTDYRNMDVIPVPLLDSIVSSVDICFISVVTVL